MTRKRKPGFLARPAAQNILRAQERRLRDWEEADLEEVLRTEPGRRLYYRIVFEVAGVMLPSFAGAIKDGEAAWGHTAFAEGRRSVGLTLAEEAQVLFPELWDAMMAERLARQRAEQDTHTRAVTADDGGDDEGPQ